jgi:predicted small secreted protein
MTEALGLGCDSVQTDKGGREEIVVGAGTTCRYCVCSLDRLLVGGRDSRDTSSPLLLRKMIMMHRFLAVAVFAWIAMLAGCNTMHGFGQDMERGGEKIQEKAKK